MSCHAATGVCPAVELREPGVTVKANFGASPYVYADYEGATLYPRAQLAGTNELIAALDLSREASVTARKEGGEGTEPREVPSADDALLVCVRHSLQILVVVTAVTHIIEQGVFPAWAFDARRPLQDLTTPLRLESSSSEEKTLADPAAEQMPFVRRMSAQDGPSAESDLPKTEADVAERVKRIVWLLELNKASPLASIYTAARGSSVCDTASLDSSDDALRLIAEASRGIEKLSSAFSVLASEGPLTDTDLGGSRDTVQNFVDITGMSERADTAPSTQPVFGLEVYGRILRRLLRDCKENEYPGSSTKVSLEDVRKMLQQSSLQVVITMKPEFIISQRLHACLALTALAEEESRLKHLGAGASATGGLASIGGVQHACALYLSSTGRPAVRLAAAQAIVLMLRSEHESEIFLSDSSTIIAALQLFWQMAGLMESLSRLSVADGTLRLSEATPQVSLLAKKWRRDVYQGFLHTVQQLEPGRLQRAGGPLSFRKGDESKCLSAEVQRALVALALDLSGASGLPGGWPYVQGVGPMQTPNSVGLLHSGSVSPFILSRSQSIDGSTGMSVAGVNVAGAFNSVGATPAALDVALSDPEDKANCDLHAEVYIAQAVAILCQYEENRQALAQGNVVSLLDFWIQMHSRIEGETDEEDERVVAIVRYAAAGVASLCSPPGSRLERRRSIPQTEQFGNILTWDSINSQLLSKSTVAHLVEALKAMLPRVTEGAFRTDLERASTVQNAIDDHQRCLAKDVLTALTYMLGYSLEGESFERPSSAEGLEKTIIAHGALQDAISLAHVPFAEVRKAAQAFLSALINSNAVERSSLIDGSVHIVFMVLVVEASLVPWIDPDEAGARNERLDLRNWEQDPWELVRGCEALAALAKTCSQEQRNSIVETGAIAALTPILKVQAPAVAVPALMALSALLPSVVMPSDTWKDGKAPLKERFGELEQLEHLCREVIRILNSTQDKDVLEAAVLCLQPLAALDSLRSLIVQKSLTMLLSLCLSASPSGAGGAAAGVLVALGFEQGLKELEICGNDVTLLEEWFFMERFLLEQEEACDAISSSLELYWADVVRSGGEGRFSPDVVVLAERRREQAVRFLSSQVLYDLGVRGLGLYPAAAGHWLHRSVEEHVRSVSDHLGIPERHIRPAILAAQGIDKWRRNLLKPPPKKASSPGRRILRPAEGGAKPERSIRDEHACRIQRVARRFLARRRYSRARRAGMRAPVRAEIEIRDSLSDTALDGSPPAPSPVEGRRDHPCLAFFKGSPAFLRQGKRRGRNRRYSDPGGARSSSSGEAGDEKASSDIEPFAEDQVRDSTGNFRFPHAVERIQSLTFPFKLLRSLKYPSAPFEYQLAACGIDGTKGRIDPDRNSVWFPRPMMKSIIMPKRMYLSFDRPRRVLQQLIGKRDSAMQRDMLDLDRLESASGSFPHWIHPGWHLSFRDAIFEFDFLSELMLALRQLPEIVSLSFTGREHVPERLAHLVGSLPPHIRDITFDGCLSDKGVESLLVVLKQTLLAATTVRGHQRSISAGSSASESGNSPAMRDHRRIEVGVPPAASGAAHLEGFGLRNHTHLPAETFRTLSSVVGIGQSQSGGQWAPGVGLRWLDLSGNNKLGDDSAARILRALGECRSLTALDLSRTNLRGAEMTAKALAKPSGVLGVASALMRLHLDDLHLTPVGAKTLLSSLKEGLRAGFMNRQAAEMMGSSPRSSQGVVRQTTGLQALSLADNSFQDNEAICDSVRGMVSGEGDHFGLVELDLRGTRLTSNLIWPILLGVMDNPRMCTLYLDSDGHDLRGDALKRLQLLTDQYLKSHRQQQLDRLLYDHDESSDAYADVENGETKDNHIVQAVPVSTVDDDSEWTYGSNSVLFLLSQPLAWWAQAAPPEDHAEPPASSLESLRPMPLLDLNADRKTIWDAFRDAKRDVRLIFDYATQKTLVNKLAWGPRALHFSGHGLGQALTFEDGRGGVHALSVESLEQLIRNGDPQKRLKFVFVSACYSRLAGEAFVNAGVPHVVCVNLDAPLADAAARCFTDQLYFRLAQGATVRQAFDLAKVCVKSSPEVRNAGSEGEKFILLPDSAVAASHHDAVIFERARPLPEWPPAGGVDRVGYPKSWRSCFPDVSHLPGPPEDYLGREVDMYLLLWRIRRSRLVTMLGEDGAGKSAVAAGLCHYMTERLFFPGGVAYVDLACGLLSCPSTPAPPNDGAGPFNRLARMVQLQLVAMKAAKLHDQPAVAAEADLDREASGHLGEQEAVPPSAMPRSDSEAVFQHEDLRGVEFILVLDHLECFADPESLVELRLFVARLFEYYREIRILAVCRVLDNEGPEPGDHPKKLEHIHEPVVDSMRLNLSIGHVSESRFALPPLSLGSSLRLFARLCPLFKTGRDQSNFVRSMNRADQQNLRYTSPRLSEVSRSIFGVLGNGRPRRIQHFAFQCSEEELDDFLKLSSANDVATEQKRESGDDQ
uniref:CHAT domain-containing protein n=1 Tax=Pinguiococcus pyrenoidosus TaxID=172671 RepID=A0A7R9U5J3_9STRA|mmetsp:Transcript_15070/g.57211  ORF Transcript_15070/g.57211 Transcript_15070/m.57211 type:complete len:2457 (+) Transcript_15070:1213-8583(+)